MDTRNDPKEAARRAVDLLGGPVNTARLVLGDGSKYQTVQSWLTNRVPADHCPAIERETRVIGDAVMCETLRPDVDWSVLRKPIKSRKQNTRVEA